MNQNTDKTIYNFTVNDIDGKPVKLSDYKGKTILIVNVASKCGYTPQYEDLQAFYDKNKDKNFVILAFPANNFLSQEPGTDAEIKSFCSSNYGVTFPVFSKISVKGKDMAPLYQFLTEKSQNGVVDAPVKWNFQKFLIDKEGRVVTFFAPGTKVTDKEFLDVVAPFLK
ncbi:MAG TPA: glutathione peroxidase [Bacteroidia bacterium]|nr:glutathione peroxidase [Bacteroidia bacterium]